MSLRELRVAAAAFDLQGRCWTSVAVRGGHADACCWMQGRGGGRSRTNQPVITASSYISDFDKRLSMG